MPMMNNNIGHFDDTTLTKVFVGGLAWETKKEALREYFEKFGEILEAIIIYDKITGKSKGYGFVTFKKKEAAKKACDESIMIINGCKANCNLASLGARRPTRSSSSTIFSTPTTIPPPQSQGGSKGGALRNCNEVQCYFPIGTPAPASPFHHQPVPFYGYRPTYITPEMNYTHNYNYNQKLSYNNGQLSHIIYPRYATVCTNTWFQMYPLYDNHRSESMILPTQIYHPTIPSYFPILPPTINPNTGSVGRGERFKRWV
ncbi:PREDICTED: probable RNA-binding protein ARP1 isoform X2 [Lupinus angustifolius]|uniref:probable RNA-binding protein ARP1 isoform X2 n=1 Tax=Lupinus angustifolius TaxID=3871 RepID=UPI00092EB1E9|nr:PREDICTED: probable RNA-binding protein ARP1 isoform X2 [Lupinus angustifolius]